MATRTMVEKIVKGYLVVVKLPENEPKIVKFEKTDASTPEACLALCRRDFGPSAAFEVFKDTGICAPSLATSPNV